ncbi:MAG: PQQ-binding-like beta-propeller repeat protein [Planctomycetaceae bacterium]|nr:PQQ-binding-like beta-propeller repeat protein [Planctomycetaceae bacterium]
MHCVRLCGVFVLLAVFAATQAPAENWPRFRGPNGQGISSETGFPVQWTEQDYAWSVDLPGLAHSSPVVWDNHLFVTTGLNDGSVRRIICLDPATGAEKWQRDLTLNTVHLHNKNSYASGSPVTNGEFVVASFADAGQMIVACWTMNGDQVWTQNLGEFISQHGPSCSPVIHNQLVIVPKDMMGPSAVYGLDLKTGKIVWETEREYRRTSYACPIIRTRADGVEEVICVAGMMGISGLNVQTGEMIWRTESFPERTVGSPVLCGDHVIAISGAGGKGKNFFSAPLDQKGDVPVSLKLTRQIPYVPTPIYKDGMLYMILDVGIASCIDAKTGEEVWTERLGGNFSGSPIWMEDRIYTIDEDGTVIVLSAGKTFQELGRVPLNDLCYSTPVVANGRLFLKTASKLHCLAK